MKLYYSKGSCSFAPRITLHELNIPCEFIKVDLKDKKTEQGEDFYKINPEGMVPVLELDNGDRLTENIAIQLYLADTYKGEKLLPHLGDIKRYHVIEALSFVGTEMHKSCGPMFNSKVPLESKETIFKPNIKNKLDYLEKVLSKHDYLAGKDFSIADAYLYIILSWLAHFNIELNQWPKVEHYFNQIKQRPSVQKSIAEGA